MQIHHYPCTVPNVKIVSTLGMFDGVHIGHKSVINTLTQKAKELHAESMVITFEPHPQIYFSKEKDSVKLLNTFDEKAELLAAAGVNHLYVLPFNDELRNSTAKEFVKNYLVDKINVSHFIVGFNNFFGKDRGGSYEDIKKFAIEYGFTTQQLTEVDSANQVSSTTIRKALSNSDIETTNLLLDYDYSLSGTVGKGLGIGSTINFPTANIINYGDYKQVPPSGVYVAFVDVEGARYKGALSIGTNPTIDSSNEIKVEVFIIDFNKDIYGKPLKVVFIDKIRETEKFPSLDALKNQLKADVDYVVKYKKC